MEYILVMSFSGSIMMLFYLMIRLIWIKRFPARWRYRILKIAMLYYLVPLPFLKDAYLKLGQYISAAGNETSDEIVAIFKGKSLLFFDGEIYHLNHVLWVKLLAATAWLLTAMLLMLWKLVQYLRARRFLIGCRGMAEEDADSKLLEKCRNDYSIRRKISCLRYPPQLTEKQDIFTFGLCKPVIVWTAVSTEELQEVVLQHEVQHIKACDVLWKVLMSFVQILHWFNPLVWWMNRELEMACEMACDEAVLKNKNDEIKKAYMELIIVLGEKRSKKSIRRNGWTFSLGREGERIKERIMNMKNEKKYWKKSVCFAAAAAMTLMSSLTVLAYEDVQYWRSDGETGFSKEEIFDGDLVFVSDMADEEALKATFVCEYETEILYDLQFVDEKGEIYPMVECDIEIYGECNHAWVSGTVQDHDKNLVGGCTITYYKAQRCSKCATVLKGEEINTITYKICPH